MNSVRHIYKNEVRLRRIMVLNINLCISQLHEKEMFFPRVFNFFSFNHLQIMFNTLLNTYVFI